MSASARPLPRLCFVRHGETEWSISGQHTGRTDIPLTARGEAQARALGPWLRTMQFARVLTSPLRRARRTCELAELGAVVEAEPKLVEWDYGDYEGQRSTDICKEQPGWNVFQDGCPRGESPAEVADRADRLITELSTLNGNLALFSHGEFGCVLGARWIALPAADGQHFALGPASLSILGQRAGHPDIRTIALWNADPTSPPGGL